MQRFINAYRYFLELRDGKFEGRKFPIWEAIADAWYEFFS